MKNITDTFPEEELILHKMDGTKVKVNAVVDVCGIYNHYFEVSIEKGEIFERSLPNGSEEYYRVIEVGFYSGEYDIPDNYVCEVEKIPRVVAEKEINEKEINNVMKKEKSHKIFISHSSKDEDYIRALVNLFEDIGLHDGEIICSSVSPYTIPLNTNIYDWLINEFQQSDLHVFYGLSQSYYNSPASLNEMGAAWALKHKWTGILMPGFGFDDIAGCIDRNQISIKLDDKRNLKHLLGELKDSLIKEFNLRPLSFSYWERKRDEFLNKIDEISERIKETEFELKDV